MRWRPKVTAWIRPGGGRRSRRSWAASRADSPDTNPVCGPGGWYWACCRTCPTRTAGRSRSGPGRPARTVCSISCAGPPGVHLSAGRGAKGQRLYDCTVVDLADPTPGSHQLPIRRSRTTGELAYYRCDSTEPVPLTVLVKREVSCFRAELYACLTARGEALFEALVRVVRRAAVRGWAGADARRPGARAGTPPRARRPLRRPQPGTDRRDPTAPCAGLDAEAEGRGLSYRAGRGRPAMAAAGRRHLP